jgi:hypothetical protein
MISAGIDFAFAASADDIARTVLSVTEKRTAAMYALLLGGFGRIKR